MRRLTRYLSFCKHRCRRQLTTAVPLINRADDQVLRSIFDAPQSSWRKSIAKQLSAKTGLLGNASLTTPAGFPEFATQSLRKAELISQYVSDNHDQMSGPSIIKAFDRLSDTLCSVLDLAEFVRNSHPSKEFIDAAETAYGILYEFMSTLNTHTGLFAALNGIQSNSTRLESLNTQEKAVLDVLLADFYRSGVHLNQQSRQEFITLSSEINKAERQAFTDFQPEVSELKFRVSEARGLWPNLNSGMMTPNGKYIRVPTSGWEADNAMQKLDLSSSREAMMRASQTPRSDQTENLDRLFVARGELAQLIGKASCGDSILARQMAKSPVQVEAFLLNFADQIRKKAEGEYKVLAELKQKHLQLSSLPDFHKWDEDYYSAMHTRNLKRRPVADLSSYFSVGTVIQGLSRLFEQLYGIRFIARDIHAGEAWHSDVRRLDIVNDDGEHIGILYCDLFSRPGKNASLAAHFTARCGRRVDDDELFPGEEFVESGAVLVSRQGRQYQIPIIALQCSFSPSSYNSFASLSYQEVSTLAHEMGHAIHSILGSTDYQTVSGTRVVADFVELPSQIMESFVDSPMVWPLIARHYADDKPAPMELMQRAIGSSSDLNAIQAYRQFMRALLDQRYHSSLALEAGFSSTAVLSQLEKDFSLTCKSDATFPWQVQFTHFSGYGGTYYSYMFDKAMADRIWHKVFQNDPLSREAGENFKTNLLGHGGAKDPWLCLADVLQQPELASGDEHAMKEVGKWAIPSNL